MDDLAVFTGHGGRIDAARARFGGDHWIDLSTGIAPWRYPADGIDLGLDRLPELGAIAALEAAAAIAFAVEDAARVVAVPGTDLAMRLLATVLRAERPGVARPGYAGHAAAWPDAAAVDPDALLSAAPEPGRHDLIVFANPSNPTGAVVPLATVRALATRTRLVVDEAYADPLPGTAPDASDTLVVLRSFGKFYGLPGLRLGFVVAGMQVAGAVRTMLGDWPVASPAVAIGTAAYRDTAWRRDQTDRIATAATALDRVLDDAGVAIVGRAPLFRLVETADAASLFRRLARHAILTRPFADRPDRLRIGLPADAAARDRLSRALEIDR